MNTSKLLESNTIKIILAVIILLAVLLAGLSLGEKIGFHKASFDFQNGNNFYQAFGPERNGMQSRDFSDAHGTVGKVISVNIPTITIEDRDNTEKVIVINPQTVIRHFRDTLLPTDIKVGDYIVAIGDPNTQSQIVARLIRELPPPLPPQQ